MTLREAAAFRILDLIGPEEVPLIATDALVAGLDSAALRQLAGEMKPPASEVDPKLRRVFTELSIPWPDRNSARLIVARFYARQIVDGTVTAYEGARLIWWGPANDALLEPEPEQVSSWLKLRHFVGCASEYKDDVIHRPEYEQDIMGFARELVDDPEAA